MCNWFQLRLNINMQTIQKITYRRFNNRILINRKHKHQQCRGSCRQRNWFSTSDNWCSGSNVQKIRPSIIIIKFNQERLIIITSHQPALVGWVYTCRTCSIADWLYPALIFAGLVYTLEPRGGRRGGEEEMNKMILILIHRNFSFQIVINYRSLNFNKIGVTITLK